MVSLILKYESCDFNVSLTLPTCPNDVLSRPALLPSWVFFCAPQQTTSIFRTEVVMSSLSPPLHPWGKKFLPIDLTPQFWENLTLGYPWITITLHQYESKRKRKEPTQRSKTQRGQEVENNISRPFSRGDECLLQGLVSASIPWVANGIQSQGTHLLWVPRLKERRKPSWKDENRNTFSVLSDLGTVP